MLDRREHERHQARDVPAVNRESSKTRTQMAIKVRHDRGVYFVSGDLDIGSAEQFLHGMEPSLDSREEVLIDVSGVTFVDSFGLRSVALLARMVGDRGVLLRYPQDSVLKVMELLDIEAIPGIRIERW
jgi:anti-anti-sigma factor